MLYDSQIQGTRGIFEQIIPGLEDRVLLPLPCPVLLNKISTHVSISSRKHSVIFTLPGACNSLSHLSPLPVQD